MAKLGATDAQMAEALAVTEQTFNNWKKAHPEFFESLKAAKEDADAVVERALFSRAKGITITVPDVKVLKDGAVVAFNRTEVIQPDVTACIFWLKNRKSAQWRDKIDHTVAGDGKTGMQDLAVEIASALVRDEVGKHLKP
jgi:DNA-binding XRE family transcriptional regulator